MFILTGLSTTFAQTTYYVAGTGSDNNTGRSAGDPFQTIDKINSLFLQPGDQVLFRRGDTFRGILQLRQSGSAASPIVIDGYGSGNKPILSGAVPLTNWNNVGNNIWQAGCSACGDRVTGLYRDNSALPLGRYPNADAGNRGYLTVQAHAGRSQLTSQQGLPANFTGGEAVYRPVQWILNRSAITGQSGNTLYLAGGGNYDISDGWGYFVQNHPATLDQNGEWYYNAGNKTIQLYSQGSPNGQNITATAFAQSINLSGASYVTIRNLQLTQALTTLLQITNGSNIVITNNDITQAGEDAIVLLGTGQQVLMEGNLIEDANNNGVNISPYQNVTFRTNTIRRIGLFPGRGKSDDGNYVGFQSKTTANTLIENNVLDYIGYIGIDFSNSTTIQRNQVSNFCLTKSDGSGIYTWNGNRQPMADIRILSNIVYNGFATPEGQPGGSYAGANGIYLDDCTTNIEVANNTVYNCQSFGLYLHGSSNIKVTGNTVYNNGETQLTITPAYGCQPRGNTVQNNTLVSRTADQPVVKYESGQNDLGSYGTIDNNVYARPYEDANKIFFYNGSTGGNITLEDWRNRYGKDLATTGSPVTYSSGNPDDNIKLVTNPTGSATQVALSGSYRDARNNVVSGQVNVPAFSSVILFKDATVVTPVPTNLRDPENPANAVTGLDYRYYEGFWTMLPDFNNLTPAKTGVGTVPTLAVASRDNSYGLTFSGYISVPTDGVYTFYTNSDDGSKLLIGSTEVVNNDGGHGDQERSGTIGLKAGVHAISILYFQGGGGQSLSVSYSGPGLGKQAIPTTAFRRVAANQTPTPTPTPTNLRNPDNPANAVAGLDYRYYEGAWSVLPDFNSLTPVKTGTSTTPVLTVRNRDDSYGLRYTGYVSVPTDGVYTFYTISDDGSKLLIGDTEVVSNDGAHADTEKSGTIGLKAGLHALTVVYFQGGGGQTLYVSYSGPNVGKQTIPAGALWRVAGNQTPTPTPTPTPVSNLRDPENPANAVTGLDYRYYEGFWTMLPDFNNLTPAKTGVGTVPTLAVASRDNSYGLTFSGYISVPTDGVYTFYTNSDDGSKLLIGSTEVVNNDGGHGDQERSGTIGLKAGVHAISILYFQGGGGQSLSVSYSGPGLGKQIIPESAFRRVTGATPTPTPTPTPTSNLRDPENPANAVAGLNYSYYENFWSNLPDFNTLTPLKTGVVNAPTLSVRSREEGYALRFTGYISVPSDGIYTFYTTSDDGSKLLIGTTEVVNNDGIHADQERSGAIGLKAGLHAISFTFFQGNYGQTFTISYTGPGLAKQLIPEAALWRLSTGPATVAPTLRTPENPANTVAGLNYSYYETYWNNLPDFSTLTPVKTGASNAPTLTVRNRDDSYGLRYTGYISVPTDGAYTFYTTSDDGTKLLIGSTEVVSNDGVHGDLERSGTIGLKAGVHALSVLYFQGGGGQTLSVSYSGPGFGKQTIPDAAFRRVAGAGARLATAGVGDPGEFTLMQVYPVPARETVWIRYQAETAGEATVQLINTIGQELMQVTHPVTEGDNLIKVNVGELNRGNYILQLVQGHRQLTRKVLLTE